MAASDAAGGQGEAGLPGAAGAGAGAEAGAGELAQQALPATTTYHVILEGVDVSYYLVDGCVRVSGASV